MHVERVAVLVLLTALTACTPDGREPLTLYSPHDRGLLTTLEQAFEAANPDIDVRWLDMGSQEVLDRLRFEKPNPVADVWFGGPTTIFDRGVSEGVVAPSRPSWAAFVDSTGIGADDHYFPVYRTPAVIAFNSRLVQRGDAPKDWDEVLAPAWRDKVLIRDPMASGTMRAIWGLMLGRSIAATGDTAQGMAWLRRLDGQTRTYALSPAILDQKLARGEGSLTLWDLPDILIAQSKGMPFDYNFPSSGTVVINDAIALVAGSDHVVAARRFIEFVGSPDAQILAAERHWRLPARRDLAPARVPAWVADVEQRMVTAPMDWQLLAKEGAGWMRYWDQRVRGTGKGEAAP